MTFDQDSVFFAIAECNTYFDAAEELNISQSALSKQIIKLEERTWRRPARPFTGRPFTRTPGPLRRQYEIMNRHMKKRNTADPDTVRLTAHFRQFTESHPDIHLIPR